MTETGRDRMVGLSVLAKSADAGEHAPEIARLAGAALSAALGRVTAFEPDAAGADVGAGGWLELRSGCAAPASFNVAARGPRSRRACSTRAAARRRRPRRSPAALRTSAPLRRKTVRIEPGGLAETPVGRGHAGGDRRGADVLLARTPNQTDGLSAGRGGRAAIATAAMGCLSDAVSARVSEDGLMGSGRGVVDRAPESASAWNCFTSCGPEFEVDAGADSDFSRLR